MIVGSEPQTVRSEVQSSHPVCVKHTGFIFAFLSISRNTLELAQEAFNPKSSWVGTLIRQIPKNLLAPACFFFEFVDAEVPS